MKRVKEAIWHAPGYDQPQAHYNALTGFVSRSAEYAPGTQLPGVDARMCTEDIFILPDRGLLWASTQSERF